MRMMYERNFRSVTTDQEESRAALFPALGLAQIIGIVNLRHATL